MARIARVVVPGHPHHVTQRGNRRQKVFFLEEDYRSYLWIMSEMCKKHGVDVWAYCLMPNHSHMIAVPGTTEGLMKAIAEAHRRYTRLVNFREGWRGFLWQGRFASFPMDELHLLAAARYVELNPVRARLVKRPEDYPWSSAKAHLAGEDDALVRVKPLLDIVRDWKGFLESDCGREDADAIRKHGNTGRPLGSETFVREMESRSGRTLSPARPGPKPKKDK